MITLSSKSNNSTIESVGLLSNVNNENETAGSLGLLMSNDSSGFDAFGGKDLFGNPDFSNMNESSFQVETAGSLAYANHAEAAGSLACADLGSICGSNFSTGDSGAGASAGGGSPCGSCGGGGGSFSSVC